MPRHYGRDLPCGNNRKEIRVRNTDSNGCSGEPTAPTLILAR